MEKNKTAFISSLMIIAALLGVFLGAVAFSTHTVDTVTKEVPKEVQVIVEKNVTVEVPVTVDSSAKLLANAIDEYRTYLDDNNVLSCKSNDYSINDVSQSGDVKELSISTDSSNKHDTKTTVAFSIKNKFNDGSGDHNCYRTDNVSVVFHSKASLDTEVTVD